MVTCVSYGGVEMGSSFIFIVQLTGELFITLFGFSSFLLCTVS